MKYNIIEELPSVQEITDLRKSIGWKEIEPDTLQKELQRTWYGLHVLCDAKVIGAARIVGDGKSHFHICDVMVWPEYQNKGIGSDMLQKMLGHIAANAKPGAIVGLVAAEGKGSFYEKFGFRLRQNARLGYEMVQYF